ncbi:MAG: transketolase [Clostridiales Family XIII bacterium]|nr:transketolase [Clostridiales Family XIII bacterium]
MNEQAAVNAIRILAADMIQRAGSGHPGLPLGAAPIAYAVWDSMAHDPADPLWENRDRFVLSGGHGSAMLYALLHLYGYPRMTTDELMRFRQLGSLTPGHPEYGHTPGVEATTGPLGAGMGMAVGMAMAEKHLAAVYNKPDAPLMDHFTYVLGGEGCFMEGISSEVFSLAGTLGLGKLIVLMDSNNITIEGRTSIAFTEDVDRRMQAFGFGTWLVEDGNDLAAIRTALAGAKADTARPSFIRVCTTIGYGAGDRAGTAKVHGEPIGEENIKILRETLGWASETPFEVPQEIYDFYKEKAAAGAEKHAAWSQLKEAYAASYPAEAAAFAQAFRGEADATLFGDSYYNYEPKADATRNISGKVLNEIAAGLPSLMGGSADLAPSNKSDMKNAGDFSADTPQGRNLHFGVRELGMTAAANGILLHGGLRAYIATFFVFSDYTKPMLRLSALMNLPLVCIFTHDSIGVGEDGPTHEPVEQLAMLRATPNVDVWRPADETETRAAWKAAILSTSTPTALALTRQNLPVIPSSAQGAEKGGYIIAKEKGAAPDGILLASGSEVGICLEAKETLAAEDIDVRVVSMPCMEAFERQDAAYKETVLPRGVSARVAVEAGVRQPWDRYTGPEGCHCTIDTFGASAPAGELFAHFGFTAAHVAAVARARMGESKG